MSAFRANFVLALLAAAGAAYVYLNFKTANGPWTTMTGTVVGFASYAEKRGNHPIVLVRLRDNSTKSVPASLSLVESCLAGDQIEVLVNGGATKVGLAGCSSSK